MKYFPVYFLKHARICSHISDSARGKNGGLTNDLTWFKKNVSTTSRVLLDKISN
jgi:hypothetical protein